MRTMYPIVLAIIVLISWGNWWFLKKWYPTLPRKGSRYAYWSVTVLAWVAIGYNWLVYPGSPFFYQWVSSFLYPSFIWVVGTNILLLLFPLLFAVRRVIRSNPSADRRKFLQKALYVAPVLAFGVSGQGVYSARIDMEIRRFELSFKDLPKGLKGFKIVQISDAHIGPFFSLHRLDETIELIRVEKPDMVVITGDLIDDLTLLSSCVEKLSQLSQVVPYGIYFCWGNHEYFRDIKRIRKELLSSPIHILENNHAPISVGGSKFYLLGVDYPSAKTIPEKNKQQQHFLAKAQENIPSGAFQILLAHHSDFLFNAFDAQIPLTLAGHTHGGQINILGRPVLPFKYYYMRGLYQEGNNYGYVNVGVGQWFPFRIGCPPEIGVFTLS